MLDEVVAGLYLVVDADGRLRWLGKAHRDDGVGARLRDHFRHPERARVFAGVFVVEADPFSPPKAIKAAEGWAADLIGLRGRMGPRTWPVVTEAEWLALVTSRPRAGSRPSPAGRGRHRGAVGGAGLTGMHGRVVLGATVSGPGSAGPGQPVRHDGSGMGGSEEEQGGRPGAAVR